MGNTATGALLEHPEGGSLNSITFAADTVIKRYAGELERGFDKLRREYWWLRALPPRLSRSFAFPTYFVDSSDPRVVELHLRRESKVAVAKAILLGELSPEETGIVVAQALAFLASELYPLRSGASSGQAIYRTHHQARVQDATTMLGRFPRIAGILNARDLVVNGRACPPFRVARAWMDMHAKRYFLGSKLVAAHGDAHLDNILTSFGHAPSLVFIDPRGDFLLPPHYDFAKMAKALRAGYDCIHYGHYELEVSTDANITRMRLSIDGAFAEHYAMGLQELTNAIPAYADAEGVTEANFKRATFAAEWAHVISFAWYHANHSAGHDHQRVSAYLAVAAMMARDLMDVGPDHIPALEPLL